MLFPRPLLEQDITGWRYWWRPEHILSWVAMCNYLKLPLKSNFIMTNDELLCPPKPLPSTQFSPRLPAAGKCSCPPTLVPTWPLRAVAKVKIPLSSTHFCLQRINPLFLLCWCGWEGGKMKGKKKRNINSQDRILQCFSWAWQVYRVVYCT